MQLSSGKCGRERIRLHDRKVNERSWHPEGRSLIALDHDEPMKSGSPPLIGSSWASADGFRRSLDEGGTRHKERRHSCRRAEGKPMNKRLRHVPWATLPQPPQECGGSLSRPSLSPATTGAGAGAIATAFAQSTDFSGWRRRRGRGWRRGLHTRRFTHYRGLRWSGAFHPRLGSRTAGFRLRHLALRAA
jgi:hypothetical protein